MGFDEITPPDFKLTGYTPFNITKQRAVIPMSYRPDPNVMLTTQMQFNIPKSEYDKTIALIEMIPTEERDLFISSLGRKNYYDEILLCVLMNADLNEFLNVIHFLYEELQTKIREVIKLTPNARTSRRRLYEHYFFQRVTPHENDAIIKSLPPSTLTVPNQNIDTLRTLQTELRALSSTEDVPVLDVLDLDLDDFNRIIKLLPKDNVWARTRQKQRDFFTIIYDDITKLMNMIRVYDDLTKKYNTLNSKFKNNTADINELQQLHEMNVKNSITSSKQAIDDLITKLNLFVMGFNSNGYFSYNKTTLPRQSTLLNDLLNSEFMTYYNTIRTRHRYKLIESIQPMMETDSSQSEAARVPLPLSDDDIDMES